MAIKTNTLSYAKNPITATTTTTRSVATTTTTSASVSTYINALQTTKITNSLTDTQEQLAEISAKIDTLITMVSKLSSGNSSDSSGSDSSGNDDGSLDVDTAEIDPDKSIAPEISNE